MLIYVLDIMFIDEDNMFKLYVSDTTAKSFSTYFMDDKIKRVKVSYFDIESINDKYISDYDINIYEYIDTDTHKKGYSDTYHYYFRDCGYIFINLETIKYYEEYDIHKVDKIDHAEQKNL